MKQLITLLLVLTAHASYADVVCTVDKIEKEAQEFRNTLRNTDGSVQYIQDCLQLALKQQSQINPGDAKRPLSLKVSDILYQIARDKMAAQVKCESTNTPGCLGDDTDVLDEDAKSKNEDPLPWRDW